MTKLSYRAELINIIKQNANLQFFSLGDICYSFFNT